MLSELVYPIKRVYITPLVTQTLGRGHTHTHTCTNAFEKAVSRGQVHWPVMPGLKTIKYLTGMHMQPQYTSAYKINSL